MPTGTRLAAAVVCQRQPDQAGLKITQIEPRCGGQPHEHLQVRVRWLRACEAEMMHGESRAPIEGWLGARPHSPQFTQEKLDGGRPPPGQRIKGGPQVGVGPVPSADLGDLFVVAFADYLGQRLQPLRGAEVIPRIATLVEQRNQVIRGHVACLGDPCQARLGKYTEGALGNRDGDARAEQGGSQEPPLDLGFAGVDVDTKLR